MGPVPKRDATEAGVRWGATIAFLVCTAGLMWLLGVSFSPTAGFATGSVLFGIMTAILWNRYLDDVRDERTRASSFTTGGRFRADTDDDVPMPGPASAPAQPTAPVQTVSYYDDDED